MAFGVPELLHAPEGTTPFTIPETQALRSRPARADSQSAAEATLGLVTIDILGLAGTGVPSGTIPAPITGTPWWGQQNLTTLSFTSTTVSNPNALLVIRAMAATAAGASIAIVSVTVAGSPLTSSGGPGEFWWLTAPIPTGTPAIVVTAASQARVLMAAETLYVNAGTPQGPVTRASGTGRRFALTHTAAASTRIVDVGLEIGPAALEPDADIDQIRDYSGGVNFVGRVFGSNRPIETAQTVTMGWTSNAAYPEQAWLLAAITIPGG
jgi:hypothetical protein